MAATTGLDEYDRGSVPLQLRLEDSLKASELRESRHFVRVVLKWDAS